MASEPWLLVDEVPLVEGVKVELSPEECRHAAGPLRLRPGHDVVLADGHGRTAQATLEEVGSRRCVAEISGTTVLPKPPARGVILALSVLHGHAMDWAVQKAVEIGVSTFQPVVAERSQLRMGTVAGRVDRWRRSARQVLKQCRRPWEMEILGIGSLADVVTQYRHVNGAVADPEGCGISELPGSRPELLLVGPEGGFGPNDLRHLEVVSWPKVRFGDYVLRAETAAIVGAAALIALSEK